MVFFTCVAMAQSEQYKSSMLSLGKRMTGADAPEVYADLANAYNRIAENEKEQWLPKYYASFCYIMQAMKTSDKDKIDGILDQADELLANMSITTKSEEIMCLQSLSRSTRIGVDPMTRGMRYGMESAKFLGEAQRVNPENPRIYYLQAQSAFYTPEAYGGGKAKAKDLFAKSLEKFVSFKPANELMPNWGKEDAERMLAECSK